jgi:hypothetical protein
MRIPRGFCVVTAVLGTIIPRYFFGTFFAAEGLNLPLFLRGLFANGAAGGFSADVLISILVFWVWSTADARRHGVWRWGWVLLGSVMVGLSPALPLYLYFRADVVGSSSRFLEYWEHGVSRRRTEISGGKMKNLCETPQPQAASPWISMFLSF